MHVVAYLDRIARILEPKEAGEGGNWRLGTVEEDGEGMRLVVFAAAVVVVVAGGEPLPQTGHGPRSVYITQ